MKKNLENYPILVYLLLLLTFIAVSCVAPAKDKPTDQDKATYTGTDRENLVKQLKTEKELLQSELSQLREEISDLKSIQQTSLLRTALLAVEMLQDEDLSGLAAIVHPVKGVRFSAYPFVDLVNDLVFTSAQLPNILRDTKVHTWGRFDGTGYPIQKTFSDYFDRFVYSKDFANPHLIGNDIAIGTGNSINNIREAYPDAVFVEFHFKGFEPKFEGMDWRSLRLVFEDRSGQWYLVGIVHGEWTI